MPLFLQAKLSISEPDDIYEQEADRMAEHVMRQPVKEEEEEEEVQTKISGTTKGSVPPSVSSSIKKAKGSGHLLPSPAQSFMGKRFGHDFSRVKVHTSQQAHRFNQQLNSRAFTTGNDIFFRRGEYNPSISRGQELLAHELTHVIQQQGDIPSLLQRRPRDSMPMVLMPQASQEELVRQAWSSRDIGAIKLISNFSSATDSQRIVFINTLLEQTWVGPNDELALARIWNSFGSRIADIAAEESNSQLWATCISRGMDPTDIRALNNIRRAFENDVKGLARGYMRHNLQYARNEQERLGLRQPEGALSPTHETEEALRLEQTQEDARGTEALLFAQDRLKAILVGYKPESRSREGFSFHREMVFFDPNPRNQPPFRDRSLFSGADDRPAHTWQDVNEQWLLTQAALTGISARNPTIFAAMAEGREQIINLGQAEPAQAREIAGRVLTNLAGNIRATLPKIYTGDLDWRDLKPIHQQLFSGRSQGASGTNWQPAFTRSIAQDVIGDHETNEFWINLGLGAAAAALFIVAEIATGGLATAALLGGLAFSGYQAGRSWENYEDLATAADTAASEDTRLVSQGQADSARFQAILDTVFTFLDIVGPAVRIARNVRLSSNLAATRSTRALENISELSAEAAAQAAQRGIADLGVAGTLRSSGKNIDELRDIIRRGNLGDAAERTILERLDSASLRGIGNSDPSTIIATIEFGTAAERAWLGSRPLSLVIADVPAAIARSGPNGISRTFGDRIIAEAIERLGPAEVLKKCGWDNLARALSDNSESGRRLMQWRNVVYEDLERYTREVLNGNMQRTGTQGNFSNDLDMSFLDANSSLVRSQAMEYLSRRVGIKNSPKTIDRVLSAGLFTDPRRMHAYDILPTALREQTAARQAALEEQLIWNRRLWEASGQEGYEELAEQTRSMMRRLNIPEFTYRPLTSGDIQRLSRDIDRLHSELLGAADNISRQQSIAREIGEKQALINAAEGGGYFSGGGVRRFVSERPGETGFSRLGGGSTITAPQFERLTAMLDQLPKLDHSLLKISGSSEDILSGMRGLGKYGQRLLEVTEEAGRFRSSQWNNLLDRCQAMKRAADSGEITSRLAMSPQEAQRIIRDSRSMFNDLILMSNNVIQQVRISSNIPSIATNAVRQLQFVTTAHVRLVRSSEWVLNHLSITARAIRNSVNAANLSGPDAEAGAENSDD